MRRTNPFDSFNRCLSFEVECVTTWRKSRSENTYVRKCKVNFLKGGDFTDFSLKRNLFHIYTVKKIFGVIFFNICVCLVKLNIHIHTLRHKYSDILQQFFPSYLSHAIFWWSKNLSFPRIFNSTIKLSALSPNYHILVKILLQSCKVPS